MTMHTSGSITGEHEPVKPKTKTPTKARMKQCRRCQGIFVEVMKLHLLTSEEAQKVSKGVIEEFTCPDCEAKERKETVNERNRNNPEGLCDDLPGMWTGGS